MNITGYDFKIRLRIIYSGFCSATLMAYLFLDYYVLLQQNCIVYVGDRSAGVHAHGWYVLWFNDDWLTTWLCNK
jgi:hypothetical protein